MTTKQTFVVVGGGVAGVCCAEELSSLLSGRYAATSNECQGEIVMVAGRHGFVKVVTNSEKVCFCFNS